LQQAMVTKKRILERYKPTKFEMPKRGMDIMGVIRDMYHKINYYSTKEDEARKVLTEEAGKMQPKPSGKYSDSPLEYEGLVKALVSLDLFDEARSIAEKLETQEYQQMEKKGTDQYDPSQLRQVAELFLEVGDKSTAVQLYRRIVDLYTSRNFNPGRYFGDIDKIHELTRDKRVLYQKLVLLEDIGSYDRAAELATELGMGEQAGRYTEMHRLVQDAKTALKT